LIRVVDIIMEKLDSNSFIARYGGDEFVIVLSQYDNAQANRFISEISKDIVLDEFLHKHNVDVTFGVANLSQSLQDLDSLLNSADLESIRAKKAKYNKI